LSFSDFGKFFVREILEREKILRPKKISSKKRSSRKKISRKIFWRAEKIQEIFFIIKKIFIQKNKKGIQKKC